MKFLKHNCLFMILKLKKKLMVFFFSYLHNVCWVPHKSDIDSNNFTTKNNAAPNTNTIHFSSWKYSWRRIFHCDIGRCCMLSIIDGYCYVVNLHFLGTMTCLVQYSRRLINILSSGLHVGGSQRSGKLSPRNGTFPENRDKRGKTWISKRLWKFHRVRFKLDENDLHVELRCLDFVTTSWNLLQLK